jgi:hypothetical protein
MKKKLVLLLVAGFMICFAVPALASSFYGMVVYANYYSVVVRNSNGQNMVFQIRPETQGYRYPKPQDLIVVDYRNDNGILIATHITLVKKFIP